ncbi:MAG: hypothetical protein V4436_02550 [Patescibacteria group bacterium]
MGEDTSLLLEAIARAEEKFPHYRKHLGAFKSYWGLTPEGPITYVEIGRRLGVSNSRASQISAVAGRALKQQRWWTSDAPEEEQEESPSETSVAKEEPRQLDPIRPVLFLAGAFSTDAASIRAVATKILRRAEKRHAYYADKESGKILGYAIDLRTSLFRLSPIRHTLEGLEYWLRVRLLHEHEWNQRGVTTAHKAVTAKGVMIVIGSPAKTRVTVIGKIVDGFDHDLVYVEATSMTRDGKNLLEGGKPQRVAIKIHKISQIALYKPWSTQ